MDAERAQVAMEKVARLHGVSVEEVESQIQAAMEVAMKKCEQDINAQKHWSSILSTDKSITPAGLITYILSQIEA